MRSYLAEALVCLGAAAAGCAEASRQEGGLTQRPDGGRTIDSSGQQQIDAPLQQQIDAPANAGSKTLSQTTDNNVAALNSLACGSSSNTNQNTYYRVFPLSDFGITTTFHVTNVTFAVEYASSAPAATVKVGTYSGTAGGNTLTTGSITVVQTKTGVAIPDADADDPPPMPGSVDVPITADINAGSNLVVELAVPSGGFFYIGTSTGGESKPGYFSTTSTASGCMPPGTTPTSMSNVAGTSVDMLMTVTGTY